MNLPLLHPALHAGAWRWDEYLLLRLGLLVVIGIASMGSKPDKNGPDAAGSPPDQDH